MTELPKPKIRHGSEKRKRALSVRVRLDEAERDQLAAKADASGLSVPAYIRAAVLGTAGPRARRRPPVERELLARTNAGLNRVGNNLNQIAKALNQAGALSKLNTVKRAPVLADVLGILKQTSAELLGALADVRRALGYDSEG